MYPSPRPSHGFFGVTVAFLGYLLLVVGVAIGLQQLGLSRLLLASGTLVTAIGLLAVFVPLFRRLMPERAGD